ncbi:hypothetical protein BT93_L2681 [Corymbia citriodora subsp. variegata]|uniref:Methyltransferase n=1 Tax=Corymbia citriodora subsp. variegata TaxID=360336 RepID=A0A8T0CLR8_CORYI|nr:hypothetical protein BT93_L2681 [Corymbia citriodora subsp. variegata]
MASGNFSLFDVRKSSNHCSRLAVIVFVAFSLSAIWIFLPSSSTFPVQSPDLLHQENNNLGQKGTDGSSGNTQIQSQDVVNNDKRTVETESGNTVQQTKADSANTVGTNQEEKIPEESTNMQTSSGNTPDKSDIESKFGDEMEDIQESNHPKSIETGEKPNVEIRNTDGGQNDGEQTMASEGSDSDEKLNSSKENDSGMDDSAKILNGQDSLEEVKQKEKEVNQNGQRVQEDQDKNFERHVADNNLETQEMLQESNDQLDSSNKVTAPQDSMSKEQNDYVWRVCNTTAGPDYIPCLDNVYAVRRLPTTIHYEHRERHCPDNAPTCLVPLPAGYRKPIQWPISRDKIWFYNVPHTELAKVKGGQNWVKVAGEYLIFPGGGTQFVHGAIPYIDRIEAVSFYTLSIGFLLP